MAAGGFQQTDLTGAAANGQGEEAVGGPGVAESNLAMGAAGSGGSSDSFLLQGTVGQGLSAGGFGGRGGFAGLAGQGQGGFGQQARDLVRAIRLAEQVEAVRAALGRGGFSEAADSEAGGPRRRCQCRANRQATAPEREPRAVHAVRSLHQLGVRCEALLDYRKPAPEDRTYDERFGGTVGGPLKIPHIYNGSDKTYFFINYQHRHREKWGEHFFERAHARPAQRTVLWQGAGFNSFSTTTTFPRSPVRTARPDTKYRRLTLSTTQRVQGLLGFIPLPNQATASGTKLPFAIDYAVQYRRAEYARPAHHQFEVERQRRVQP